MQRMFERFRPSQEGTLLSGLKWIKQEGMYEEYRKKVESYATPIPEAAKNVLQKVFINGLLREIKAEVKCSNPVALDECMVQAQAVSDQNLAL